MQPERKSAGALYSLEAQSAVQHREAHPWYLNRSAFRLAACVKTASVQVMRLQNLGMLSLLQMLQILAMEDFKDKHDSSCICRLVMSHEACACPADLFLNLLMVTCLCRHDQEPSSNLPLTGMATHCCIYGCFTKLTCISGCVQGNQVADLTALETLTIKADSGRIYSARVALDGLPPSLQTLTVNGGSVDVVRGGDR
jgi:hypothetical protein